MGRRAPGNQDDLAPGAHSAGKGERHAIFAEWIATHLLGETSAATAAVTAERRVIDVAGGKGHLSAALVQAGLLAALVDPCEGPERLAGGSAGGSAAAGGGYFASWLSGNALNLSGLRAASSWSPSLPSSTTAALDSILRWLTCGGWIEDTIANLPSQPKTLPHTLSPPPAVSEPVRVFRMTLQQVLAAQPAMLADCRALVGLHPDEVGETPFPTTH